MHAKRTPKTRPNFSTPRRAQAKLIQRHMRKDYLKALQTALKIFILCCTLTAWAQDTEPSAQPSTSADLKSIDNEEVLPDIEAETYQTRSSRRSKSLRVYLFDLVNAPPPAPEKASDSPPPSEEASSDESAEESTEESPRKKEQKESRAPKPRRSLPRVGKILLLTQ